MSLHESPSATSLASGHTTGLLSGPSDTDYRRQRLQRIGSPITQNHADEIPRETTALHAALNGVNYGTVPIVRSRRAISNAQPTHSLPTPFGSPPMRSATFSGIEIPGSPTSLRETFRRRISQRPISAYDASLVISKANTDTDLDVKTNGYRVWYSSFSSIDWLHDTIKDSVRFARLRRSKTIRSRVRLAFDKSLGWIIVTVVGFLTAIVAFLVVRAEQWLFDVKQGYCTTTWRHAQEFCCPQLEDYAPLENPCSAWRTWSDVYASWIHSELEIDKAIAQYVAYTTIAVCSPGIFAEVLDISRFPRLYWPVLHHSLQSTSPRRRLLSLVKSQGSYPRNLTRMMSRSAQSLCSPSVKCFTMYADVLLQNARSVMNCNNRLLGVVFQRSRPFYRVCDHYRLMIVSNQYFLPD
jgi:chloride channel 3/4/5